MREAAEPGNPLPCDKASPSNSSMSFGGSIFSCTTDDEQILRRRVDSRGSYTSAPAVVQPSCYQIEPSGSTRISRHLRERRLHPEACLKTRAPRDLDSQKGASCRVGHLQNARAALGFQSCRPLPVQRCTLRSVHPAQDPRPLLLRAHLGRNLRTPVQPVPLSQHLVCEHHAVQTSTRKTWEEQRLSILRGSLCKQSGQNKVNKQRSTDSSVCNSYINLKPRMLTPVVEYADTHSQGLPGFTTQPLSRDFRLGSWHCASAAVFGADARSAGVKASLAVDSAARLRVAAGIQRLVFPCFCHLQDF